MRVRAPLGSRPACHIWSWPADSNRSRCHCSRLHRAGPLWPGLPGRQGRAQGSEAAPRARDTPGGFTTATPPSRLRFHQLCLRSRPSQAPPPSLLLPVPARAVPVGETRGQSASVRCEPGRATRSHPAQKVPKPETVPACRFLSLAFRAQPGKAARTDLVTWLPGGCDKDSAVCREGLRSGSLRFPHGHLLSRWGRAAAHFLGSVLSAAGWSW